MKPNIYKQARLKAAEQDATLKTTVSAYAQLCISKDRLQKIEQEDPGKKTTDPNPDEVVIMARTYGAPELCDYYCTHQCPIGRGRTPLLHDNLSEISAGLLSALHFVVSANDKIYRILGDSKIADSEKAEFRQIVKTLQNIAYSADSLELWAKKNGLLD